MKQISDALQSNKEVQNMKVVAVIEGVMKRLEEKAVGLGTVVHTGLKETLIECLEQAGVIKVVRKF
jgi:ACT domain-containing protein